MRISLSPANFHPSHLRQRARIAVDTGVVHIYKLNGVWDFVHSLANSSPEHVFRAASYVNARNEEENR